MITRLLLAGTLSFASAIALANDGALDSKHDKSATAEKDRGQHSEAMDHRAVNSGFKSPEHARNEKGMTEATFNHLDANQDKTITRDEFDSYFSKAGTFGNVDTNGDGMIGEDEYEETAWDVDFDELDADDDGTVRKDEFYNALFSELDENNNLLLDEDEWDEARDTGFFDV